MKLQLQEVMQDMQHKTSSTIDSPFIASIRDKALPSKFKMSSIDTFDDTTDPVDHVEAYQIPMILYVFPDEIMCCIFLVTLKGSTRLWFSQLPPDSATSFHQLSETFLSHFIGAQQQRHLATQLLNIRQTKGESLLSFFTRFNIEALQVEENDDKVILNTFMVGLCPSDFLFFLSKNPPSAMVALLAKTKKYMNVEDSLTAFQDSASKNPPPKDKRKEPKHRS
ncbi:uncharacterized protein LOC114321024 [Camellia sinensis]|uniref:uncharacterized protein LOC114321024 n=1 Tax=Camellia sinensis TaxID=4442 RepID=UPI0010362C06|nr:uncharacterized protein LOC114321024 [Camellia sinensis]